MKKDKHIVFLVASLGVGGAQKIASFVMNTCAENGYRISVYSLADDPANVDLNSNIEVHYFKYRSKNKIGKKLDEIFIVKKEIIKLKPDLICIFGSYSFPSIGLYLSGIPIIGCERGDPYTYTKLRQFINKILYKKYCITVFQSEGARDYYKLGSSDSYVICNPCFPIDTQFIGQENTICAAGRLSEDKGFDTLIEAFDYIKDDIDDFKLIIYGEGSYREELHKKIISLNLEDRVILYGKVKKLTDYICNSKLFVLSSWYEGLPNVLIEAMSLGMPIVATDCSPGGARFLMNNGKRGGVIVPVDDYKSMAKAILKALKNYEDSLELGKLGKELVTLYPEDKIAIEWLSIFDGYFKSENNR